MLIHFKLNSFAKYRFEKIVVHINSSYKLYFLLFNSSFLFILLLHIRLLIIFK